MVVARRTLLHVLTAAGIAGVLAIPATSNAVSPPEAGQQGAQSLHAAAEKQDALTAQLQLRTAATARLAGQAAQRATQQQAQQAQKAQQAQQARASRSRSLAPTSSDSPRQTARAMLAARGESDQFGCLSTLWDRESGWNVSSSNASSGAYGIPQALPGSRMATAGADWRTNPSTQISWGLGYIDGRYGGPCSALQHSSAYGWY